jgi:NAD(P)-dependent dehydrogenase (short-subunit alcohol dehydrogenase family)
MEDSRGLRNKAILITGGCGDIGRAIAEKLSLYGARIVLLDLLDESAGASICRKVGAKRYLKVDQGEPLAIQDAVVNTAAAFSRIDCVIGNAASGAGGRLLDVDAAGWNHALRVNLTGCAMLAKVSVKIMMAQAPDEEGIRGKILFTSSWVGEHACPGAIQYCVSKAGLNHLVRLAAQEYAGKGIRVNGVAPGILDAGFTRKAFERDPELRQKFLDMIPVGEFGNAAQVADAFAFLCSKESNYITGHILFVDGGCVLARRE